MAKKRIQSSAMRKTNYKGDNFRGSVGDYRSGYDNIDWSNSKKSNDDEKATGDPGSSNVEK